MLSGSHCAWESQPRSPSSREYGATKRASSGDEGGRIQRPVSLDGHVFMTLEIETEMALIRGGAVVCCFVVRRTRTPKRRPCAIEQGSVHRLVRAQERTNVTGFRISELPCRIRAQCRYAPAIKATGSTRKLAIKAQLRDQNLCTILHTQGT